ncbi:MAG: hypothetical protein K5744_06400 [Eubacterium sp.]|nr:hypothetical protein [Eubacterium sp.]
MKELAQLLSNISDAYDDFILGVINFAKKDISHAGLLNRYMRENPNVTSSDVIAFIMDQPDFHDFSATKEMKHVG